MPASGEASGLRTFYEMMNAYPAECVRMICGALSGEIPEDVPLMVRMPNNTALVASTKKSYYYRTTPKSCTCKGFTTYGYCRHICEAFPTSIIAKRRIAQIEARKKKNLETAARAAQKRSAENKKGSLAAKIEEEKRKLREENPRLPGESDARYYQRLQKIACAREAARGKRDDSPVIRPAAKFAPTLESAEEA